MSGTEETSAKILEYLKKNTKGPDAMDVAEWWDGIQDIGPSLDDITLAIEELLTDGTIKKQDLEDDAFYYELS